VNALHWKRLGDMMDQGAVCPNCEARLEGVGTPCPQAVCQARGYRAIPANWFLAAKEWCQRKGRPLDPLLGRRLDRYLLAGKLGEGGMGAVYLALQEPLMREVALKLVSGLELNPASEARFEREARTISALDHPNIVKLFDYGIGDLGFRVPFMALEYVRHGRTLRQVFPGTARGTGEPDIGVREILSVFEQVLHALGAAHDQGIIHRDVKPENVMVAPVHGNPWFVKVLDFGLAKVLEQPSRLEISRTGQPMGTPIYMAPEQAYGDRLGPVDGRVDLYAVAVMLYEVFTGQSPFPGDSSLRILTRKVDLEWRPLDQPVARDLPSGLRAFLEQALRPRPEDRFPRADRMLEALREALRDLPGHAWKGYDSGATPPEDHPATPSSPPEGEPVGGLHDGRTLTGLPGLTPAAAPAPRQAAPDEEPIPHFHATGSRRRWVWMGLALLAAAGLLWGALSFRQPTERSAPAASSPVASPTGGREAPGPDATPTQDVPDPGVPGDAAASPDSAGKAADALPETGLADLPAPALRQPPATRDAPPGQDRPSTETSPPRKPRPLPRTLPPEVRRRPPPMPPDPTPEPPARKFHLK